MVLLTAEAPLLYAQSSCSNCLYHRYLRRWCDDWGRDLELRPEDVKDSGPGTLNFFISLPVICDHSQSYPTAQLVN